MSASDTRARSHETIQVGAMAVRFLVEAPESGGSVSVFECYVPAAGRMPAPHSHDAFEETIYGLEGVTTFTIDGEPVSIGPGETVCIPRGAVHSFRVEHEDASFLAIATPGVFGPEYFRELEGLVRAAAGGPPRPADVAAVMRRHGLTPATQDAV